jgi:hypothetical protein
LAALPPAIRASARVSDANPRISVPSDVGVPVVADDRSIAIPSLHEVISDPPTGLLHGGGRRV